MLRLLEGTSRVNVYDATGIDVLRQDGVLVVECLYNPRATTAAGSPLAPTVGLRSPVLTDVALRHTLMQPRQQLAVWFDSDLNPASMLPSEFWVYAPYPGYEVDADNGPKPLECVVTQAVGDGTTFLVRYAIQYALLDCQIGSNAKAIVSNRYTTSIGWDEAAGEEVRTIQGVAVFNPAVLKKLATQLGRPITGDHYRSELLPPVPKRWQREITNVSVLADGLTIEYVVTDREKQSVYLDQPTTKEGFEVSGRSKRHILKVEATASRRYSQPNAGETLLGITDELGSAYFATADAAKASIGIPGTGVEVDLGVLARLGIAALKTTNKLMPSYYETATVTVYGSKYAKRSDLQKFAYALVMSVVQARTPPPKLADIAGLVIAPIINQAKIPAAILPPAMDMSLSWDLTRKVVSVTASISYSGLVDMLGQAQLYGRAAMLSDLPDAYVGGSFPAWFIVQDVAAGALFTGTQSYPLPDSDLLLITDGDGQPPLPPGDGKSRGSDDLVLAPPPPKDGCGAVAAPGNLFLPNHEEKPIVARPTPPTTADTNPPSPGANNNQGAAPTSLADLITDPAKQLGQPTK